MVAESSESGLDTPHRPGAGPVPTEGDVSTAWGARKQGWLRGTRARRGRAGNGARPEV